MILKFVGLLLFCFSLQAQTWSACSFWSFPVPVTMVHRCVALPLPTSYDRTSLVSVFTTTNTPELLGDLTGATISATVRLVTRGDPILWFSNDTGGPQNATIRLYFTTTTELYNVDHANRNEAQYWWADYAMANLSDGEYSTAIPGTYTLTTQLDPALWSDSLGHSGGDPAFTAAFYEAVSHVAQIGFSCGGGCFFDTGIGIYNPDQPESVATLYVKDYCISGRVRAISEEFQR